MYNSLSSESKFCRIHDCILHRCSLFRRLVEWAPCEPHGKARSCDAVSNQHRCYIGIESSKNPKVSGFTDSWRQCIASLKIRFFFYSWELFERSGRGSIHRVWLVTRHSLADANEYHYRRLQYPNLILMKDPKALVSEAVNEDDLDIK